MKLRKFLKIWAQNLANNYEKLKFNEKLHRIPKTSQNLFPLFARYYDAEEVIHKHISWNWENISKSGPKIRWIIMKNWNLMKRCIGSGKPHRTFFPFSQDITMLKKWFISAFPEIEKISQNLDLQLGQKLWKIESLMKRCIGSAKTHTIDFRFFARYYDAEGERISWNWEIISKSGPKVRTIIMKNWILMKRCIGPQKPHRMVFPFSQDITMLKKWFISAFPEIEKISQNLDLQLGQKLWKIESLMKRCIGSTKHHKTVFSLFRKILRCWRSDS